MKQKKLPSPITILIFVIVFAAICTWIIPAGKYDTLSFNEDKTFVMHTSKGDTVLPATQKTLDNLKIKVSIAQFRQGEIKKPLSIPGSYHTLKRNKQSFVEVLQAPLKGIYDSVDVIFFILIIGAFMQVFNQSGAMEQGLKTLSYRMNGKETWLIVILTFLFSFAGASYGMAEEALVFYAVLVPVFLAAGYDLIVPVAVIFGGTQLGTLASFSNPFSTIIASNAAGINWTDGITERIIIFFITTIITIWYIIRYAQKVKKDPTKSLVFKVDGILPNSKNKIEISKPATLSSKTMLLLFLFLATFLTMIAGVVWFGWWLTEMSSLFIVSSIIVAIILKMGEANFINEFIKGAESLLSVALIVGIARGVTVILNEGKIGDSIVFYAAQAVGNMPPSLFIVMVMFLFIGFTFFISSSSGMAVLTMPIMGLLGMIVGVPGREMVNAYLFGMGIMGFLTPTGLILPSLAIVNVSVKAWFKFILPLIIILTIVCIICLLIGIHFK